jgi:dTDP-4-amino-4,6-dideoxygalactose transaminase
MWPPLPLGVYLRPPIPVPPFPLGSPGCRLVRKARQALFLGIEALGLRADDEILMPAFHHGSEVEAVLRSGLICRFYDVGPDLQPDAGQLDALVGPGTRALYLTHYLGFPQDAPGWLRWCQQRGLLLIEDAAQAWLGSVQGQPVGSFGDLAIFSFYKTIGVPEGGAVVTRPPVTVGFDGQPAGTLRFVRRLASRHEAWLTSRSALLASLRTRSARPWSPSATSIRLGDVDAAVPGIISYVVPRLLEPDPAERRRRNYRVLLGALEDQVLPSLAILPEQASPYFFPIQTNGKAELLARLDEHGIDAVDFWAVPHPSLPARRYPSATRLRTSIIGVPVHQELRPGDLERIITAARRNAGLPRAKGQTSS